MAHKIKCWNCRGRTEQGALRGMNNNLCAHCGKPVYPKEVETLRVNTVYAEKGGEFIKVNDDEAICTRVDVGYAFDIGGLYGIDAGAVYPY